MLPPLEEIERRRKSLGLTQKQLAKMVGISQSMVAKIESKKINPSYLKTKSIFDFLESLELRREVKAKEILHKEVVGIGKDEALSKASRLMHQTGYSQLPVFNGQQVVGSISERTVLNQILGGKDVTELSRMKVESVMEDAFPQVDEETPLTVISTLLQYNSAVLATKKGQVKGIITKADLLKVVRSR